MAEISLDESIRYAASCPVEKWLNDLLCLDSQIPRANFTLPSPEKCSLYWINRDVLFSGNKSSEGMGILDISEFTFCILRISWTIDVIVCCFTL